MGKIGALVFVEMLGEFVDPFFGGLFFGDLMAQFAGNGFAVLQDLQHFFRQARFERAGKIHERNAGTKSRRTPVFFGINDFRGDVEELLLDRDRDVDQGATGKFLGPGKIKAAERYIRGLRRLCVRHRRNAQFDGHLDGMPEEMPLFFDGGVHGVIIAIFAEPDNFLSYSAGMQAPISEAGC